MKIARSLLAITFLCSEAQAGVVIHFRDESGFTDAVRTGDTNKVDSLILSTTDPQLKQLFISGKLRIKSDLTQSTYHAKKCYDPGKVDNKSPLSMLCGLMIAGNALNDGDVATWARISQFIKEKTASKYAGYVNEAIYKELQAQGIPQDGLKKTQYTIDLLSFVDDYKSFENWPYTTKLSPQKIKNIMIPIDWHGSVVQGRSSRLPFVQFEINGKNLEGLLDTGTEGNILLDRTTAYAIGITHITPGWSTISRLGGGHLTTSLANAKTVVLGGVTLQDVPVTIADTDAPTTIGLNLLRQLGGFSLSSNYLTINHFSSETCTTSLSIGSMVSGPIGMLTYPIKANDSNVQAIIDTGAPMLLYEMVDKLPSLPTGNGKTTVKTFKLTISTSSPNIPYRDARGDFEIDGKQYFNMSHPTFQRDDIFNYGIGSWILRKKTLKIDFKSGLLCM